MKAQIPWSVKGVEPDAREAAKAAARRAGLTLGAWLNQVIRDSGVPAPRMIDVTEERRAQGFAPVGEPRARPTLVRMETDKPQEQAQGAESFTAVMRRLNAVEGKTGRIVQALESTLKDIAERLPVEARGRPSSSDKALQESLSRLSARLDTLETETAARSQALEQGLGEIAHHYSDIEARHERGRQDVAHSIERLAERIAQGSPAAAGEIDLLRNTLTSLETRIDDVSADSRKTAQAVESALNALSSRLSAAERRQRSQEGTLERALTLFNERLQEALAREDDGQSEALRALEQAVGDISQHFEAIERRREQTNRAVEDSLRAIVSRLAETDRRQTEEAHAPVDAVENALRRMMNRLEDTEKRSAEVVVTLDKRVQELRERFERTESEFRASRIAIMRAIDDVSDHVGTLESDREVQPLPTFLTTPKEQQPAPPASETTTEILRQADEQENEPAEREVRALVEHARKRARTEEAEPEMEPSPEPQPDTTDQSPSFYMPRSLGAPAAGLRDAEEEAEQRQRRRVFHLSLALAAGVIVLVVVVLVTWSGIDENGVASGRPSALQTFKNALGIAQTRIEEVVNERAKPAERKQAAAAPPAAVKTKTETAENDPKAIAARGIALAREATTPLAEADAAAQIGRAAALGDADAQFALGRLFETGRGVTQDRTVAARWYEEAASQGHALAMYNLGALAASLGSKEGYTRAARWFEQAAIRGVKDAQFNLAKLYEQGLGVSADPIEAYAWYAAAAVQGDKEAAQAVVRLAKSMSPSQRAEAGERARKKQSSGG